MLKTLFRSNKIENSGITNNKLKSKSVYSIIKGLISTKSKLKPNNNKIINLNLNILILLYKQYSILNKLNIDKNIIYHINKLYVIMINNIINNIKKLNKLLDIDYAYIKIDAKLLKNKLNNLNKEFDNEILLSNTINEDDYINDNHISKLKIFKLNLKEKDYNDLYIITDDILSKSLKSSFISNSSLINKIKDYNIDDNQDILAKNIKDKFIYISYINKLKYYNILYKKNNNLKLIDFHKSIFHPLTIINILSKLYNMSIANKEKILIFKIYKNYGNYNYVNFLLTFLDTLNINVLYIRNDGTNDYISPLNNKKYRNYVKYNDSLTKTKYYSKYALDKLVNDNKVIDCSKYDIVLKYNYFNDYNNNNKVSLLLSDDDYKGSLLLNEDFSHVTSITKCDNLFIFNTTWYQKNKYIVNNFNPKSKDYYKIFDNICLKKIVYSPDLKNYYKSFNENIEKYEEELRIYDTVHIYSSKSFDNKKIYKSIGGTIGFECNNLKIPSNNKCGNIYFPPNRFGTCWFSSIFNILFNSDDITFIVLNKTLRFMNKTIDYINEFIDNKTYDIINFNNETELKKLYKYVIYMISYIYSSYFLLSKNKLNEKITNKKKWKEIYDKIMEEKTYQNIYLYFIILESKAFIY